MSSYSLYCSLKKHFRRMSTLDKLDFVIALWTDRCSGELTKGQEAFLDKVSQNASGYASSEEVKEDVDRFLKLKF